MSKNTHPALEALRHIERGFTWDEPIRKQARAAIPALEALIEERGELLGALEQAREELEKGEPEIAWHTINEVIAKAKGES